MSKNALTHTRDIVVIGCSAGGVDALPRIVHQLPNDFPASVFVVQHMAPSNTPYLVDILKRAATLPVTWAEQGERIARSHIYVAPPDVHLMFTDDHLALSRGARENHSRPAIDKLFRSAAAVHGSRVIGVLLTGMLDDGVAGLAAIRAAGGVLIVQDPNDAAFPELPSRALTALTPDRVLPLDAIGTALHTLVGEQVSSSTVPETVALEAAMDLRERGTPHEMQRLGPQSSISCPECAGPTWQVGTPEMPRYRCYLGHVMSAREILARGDEQVETALWTAVRALSDRATTLETLAQETERSGNHQSSQSYAQRGREARTHADLARQFMLDLTRPR